MINFRSAVGVAQKKTPTAVSEPFVMRDRIRAAKSRRLGPQRSPYQAMNQPARLPSGVLDGCVICGWALSCLGAATAFDAMATMMARAIVVFVNMLKSPVEFATHIRWVCTRTLLQ
jgi:hypothetical protein